MPYKDPAKQKAAQRAHFDRNKEVFAQRVRDRRNLALRLVQQYKIDHPSCVDCRKDYPPYVLAFDHVPGRGKKIANLSNLARDASIELVKEEIKKCDVVCHNCHAVRTWSRPQGLEAQMAVQLPVEEKDAGSSPV